VALLVTLVSAVWQRMTGPSYPARGTVTLAGTSISYRLARSHVTGSDQPVAVTVADPSVTGSVRWRRFPSRDQWSVLPMHRTGGELVAALPAQPAAGKLEYQVELARGEEKARAPSEPAVTRYRGAVPAPVLVTHIFLMFFGMLFSNAAGLSAALGRRQMRRQSQLALALLGVGGFAFGPLVQKFAFGAFWTGVPFGYDLTDNKTLIAVAVWAAAVFAARGGRQPRALLLAAALVTLAVFAIPHSLFGSEIRWDQTPTPRP
jgi:hypothetical protein